MRTHVDLFTEPGDTFEAAEVCGEPSIRVHPKDSTSWRHVIYFGNDRAGDGMAEAVRQLRDLAAAVNAALNMATEAMAPVAGPDDPTDEPDDEPEVTEFDPGPEVDDEGGMSEYRTEFVTYGRLTLDGAEYLLGSHADQVLAAGAARGDITPDGWPVRRAGAHL